LYRVVYPISERPEFRVGSHTYQVIDCSERGLRYQAVNGRLPSLGTPLTGILAFRRFSKPIEIAGEVIRSRGDIVVLSLDAPGIPFSQILAEQTYLQARGFPPERVDETAD
jgi:hypothetical protein